MEIPKNNKIKFVACTLALGFFTAASALATDVSREITSGSFSNRVYAGDTLADPAENSSLVVRDADGTNITFTSWANFYGGLYNAGVSGTSFLSVSGLKYTPTTFSNNTILAFYGGNYLKSTETLNVSAGSTTVSVSDSDVFAMVYGGSQVRGTGVVTTAGTTSVSVSNVVFSGHYNGTYIWPGAVYGSANVDQGASYDGGAATVVANNVKGVTYGSDGQITNNPGLYIYGGGKLIGSTSASHFTVESTSVSVGGSETRAEYVFGGSVVGGDANSLEGTYVSVGHTSVSVDGGFYKEHIVGGNFSNSFGKSYVGVLGENGEWTADASAKYATDVVVKATSADSTAMVIGGSYSLSTASPKCAPDAHVYGDTHVRIESGATVAKVIGGGRAQTAAGVAAKSVVHGDTHVEIAGGNLTEVYGGGYYYTAVAATQHDGAMVTGDTHVSISGGNISGDVVAGGVNSSVDGSTNLVISGGTIGGDVYAGSYMANVGGNATVTISGGTFTKEGAVIDGCAGSVSGTSVLNIVNTGATAGTTIKNFDEVVVSGTSDFTIGTVADGVKLTAFGGTIAGTQFTAGTVANVSAGESGAIAQENQSVSAGSRIEVTHSESTVVLSTTTEAITVSKAESIATADVVLPKANETVVAAWSFEITKEADTEVMVTLDVGPDVGLDSIRVYHKADDAADWNDVTGTDQISNVTLSEGKLSFITKSFSSYAAAIVPEPSAFGLFAGLGALALVASRRRRQKKA